MAIKKLPFLLLFILFVGITACDESTNEPVDPDVSAPTNLRASSADEAIILRWDPSVSEGQENFGGYKLRVLDMDTDQFAIENAPRGDGYTVANLKNGTRYEITVWAVTTAGKESAESFDIEWAPAIRRSVNQDQQAIRVYATTSTTFNSAVDLFNESGICEVIPQAGQEFRDRGDLFVHAPNATSNFMEIKSPSTANNQGMVTQFSSVSYDADALDEHTTTTAPSNSTYSKQTVTIPNAEVSQGKIVYGRISRGTDYYYFRLLVKRGSNNKLIQGSGNDRYLEFDVSFQHIRNMPFAKY